MPFEFVSTQDAIAKPGLRMVVIGNIPSPWSESAKGIFAVKGIEWVATRLVYDDPALPEWIGELSAPAAVLDDEAPRTGWDAILLLAERLAPQPSLLPEHAAERAVMMGLSHELLGEGGLCWSRRLQGIHAGLSGNGGFAPKVSAYLGAKYGYQPERGEAASLRVCDLLRMFADRLQASTGDYLMGEQLTAADIHLATSMAMFAPLPPEQCAMRESYRETFSWLDAPTKDALHPTLLEHRDRIYARHLELPLAL